VVRLSPLNFFLLHTLLLIPLAPGRAPSVKNSHDLRNFHTTFLSVKIDGSLSISPRSTAQFGSRAEAVEAVLVTVRFIAGATSIRSFDCALLISVPPYRTT
jgi:hypothetical protein